MNSTSPCHPAPWEILPKLFAHLRARDFLLIVLLAAAAMPIVAPAQISTQDDKVKARIAAWVAGEWEKNKALYKGNTDVLVRRALVANRKTGEVQILTSATGLGKGSPVEFLVVTPNGNDYEASCVTYAVPSEIIEALEFIGMKSGRPIDYKAFKYWPRGERVVATVEWTPPASDGETAELKKVALEHLVADTRTNKLLPAKGFVFVGNKEQTDNGDAKRYEVDISGSIASAYNVPFTIFDVPRRAFQGELYGKIVPNDALALKAGQQMLIRLKPAKGLSRMPEIDLHVTVRKAPDTEDGFALTVRDGAQKELIKDASTEAFLTLMLPIVQGGREPFLHLTILDDTSAKTVAAVFEFIHPALSNEIFRLEPMPAQPWYEAFRPNEDWRLRENRPTQPVEIHFAKGVKAPQAGRFVLLEETFSDAGEVDITATEKSFNKLADLTQLIKAGRPWRNRALFIFADPGTHYGALMDIYRLCREDFHFVYFFVTKDSDQK